MYNRPAIQECPRVLSHSSFSSTLQGIIQQGNAQSFDSTLETKGSSFRKDFTFMVTLYKLKFETLSSDLTLAGAMNRGPHGP